jgi:methylenetetrahydrofolate reductase (NADPH)
MGAAGYRNRVREALEARRFLLSIEIASPHADQPIDEAIRDALEVACAVGDDSGVDAVALTDRSRSDEDCDPIILAHRVADASGSMPIVHLAGKDRTPESFEANLRRARERGLDTLLLVTGDALRRPPADCPVRYLDSVHALRAARDHSHAFLLAAALCPFKYREEELLNQYLKAGRKIRCGADLLITQIGWDMRKYEEARQVLADRGYPVPLVAGLLLLRAPTCRRIRQQGLPGVVVTDDLAHKVEEEARAPDGGRAAAFRRLALQIVGVRLLGYAGAQVSGLHRRASVVRLLDEIAAVSHACPTREAWQEAWDNTLILSDGRRVQVAPPEGFYLTPGSTANGARPGASESLRYRVMDLLDHAAFRRDAAGARVVGALLRGLDHRPTVDQILFRLESAIKTPLVGCQGCGFCRLPDTAYVCPETCPKGLANGPCGGTSDNRCEFGDRECVHNRIYRLSKARHRLADLEEVFIPPVPETTWHTCSWLTHFRGEGPRPVRVGRGGMDDPDRR